MKATLSKAKSLVWLDKLQACHLKRLAFITGVRSTGTKAEIRSLLEESLVAPRLPHPDARILSVDMGVKNLAFCLLELRQQRWTSEVASGAAQSSTELPLRLSEWKRLDLTSRLLPQSLGSANVSSDAEHAPVAESEVPPPAQANMYSPSQLSKVAYTLASEFVKHKPDVILIERQRFRSGGAPAIQEWTVRVNMLESMLWASLETMKHNHNHSRETNPFPSVIEASPRQVGAYWLAQDPSEAPVAPASITAQLGDAKSKDDDTSTDMVKSKRSLEKKDKIALVRYWLRPDAQEIELDAKLTPALAAFGISGGGPASISEPKKRRKMRKKAGDAASSGAEVDGDDDEMGTLVKPGKLDDLADCVVQGVTFALWEENRRRVLAYDGDRDLL